MLAPRTLRAGLATATLVASCASPPEVTVPLELGASAFLGTALTGPSLEREAADLDGSWLIVTELSWHEELPQGERPLGGRLVIREGATDLFVTRSELASGIEEGLAAGWRTTTQPGWTSRREVALPEGTTQVLEATYLPPESSGPREPAGPEWSRARLEISRPHGQPAELLGALVLDGEIRPLVRDDGMEQAGPAPIPEPISVSERLVLDRPPVVNGRRLALVLEIPTAEAPRAGLVAEVRVTEPDEPLDAALLSRVEEEIEAAGRVARQRARRFQEQLVLRSESMGQALARGRLPRSAVITIAQSAGASIGEELALVATEEDLADFVRYAAERRQAEPARTPEELGWVVERRAISWLLTRLDSEEEPLPAELQAVLIRAGGALAASPDLFTEVLEASSDLADLRARIVAENRAALEDARPAPRVRGFDWLEASGLAPEGFDPLADRDARREALERSEELEGAER